MADIVHLCPHSGAAGERRRELVPSTKGRRSAHRFDGKYVPVLTDKKICSVSGTVRHEIPARFVRIAAFPVAQSHAEQSRNDIRMAADLRADLPGDMKHLN